jgi:peroxiredoxin
MTFYNEVCFILHQFHNFAIKFLKKISAFLLFILLQSAFLSQAQVHIIYTVKGLNDTLVTLSEIRGSVHTKVDSTVSDKGIVRFDSEKCLPIGVYRIAFGKNLFTDIILNHENIVIQNDFENMLDSLVVSASEENKIYYDYWRTSMYVNDSIDLITKIGQKIYEANNKTMTPDLDSMARKVYQLDKLLKNYTQNLITKSSGMYVQKLLLAYLEPDWDTYKAAANAIKYPSRKDFLKKHFFDHVDFSDSTLLNSEVFYVLCTDYLTKFVDPESDSAYSRAVDFILRQAKPETPIYTYILNLLVNTFGDTQWEATFVHLVDDYLLKNTCEQTANTKTMAERAAIMKKLRAGNPAPDFISTDVNGNNVNLYSIKSKAILLWFWSSSCQHCEKVMMQIQDIYKKYHPLGLEIVAVSLDTDKKNWLYAIQKNHFAWINLTDLKGAESSVIENYNAFSTPDFFILDAAKNIIAHPYSPSEMQEAINKVFGN